MRTLHVRDSASVFAALGDETRLQILARLGKEGPASIVRLSDGFAMSRQAITKHLHVLEGAGLVRGSRPDATAAGERAGTNRLIFDVG